MDESMGTRGTAEDADAVDGQLRTESESRQEGEHTNSYKMGGGIDERGEGGEGRGKGGERIGTERKSNNNSNISNSSRFTVVSPKSVIALAYQGKAPL